MNWTWNVALPLVETASGWLSKDRIAAINKELTTVSSNPQKRVFHFKLEATVAAVFHFLATICEMFGSEDQKNGSVHPVVHQIALALASNNLLTFKKGGTTNSMLEMMVALWGKVDEEMAMAITSCIYGLVRLLNVTDQLYQGSKTEEHEILSRGLVASADGELRALLTLVGNDIINAKDIKPAGHEADGEEVSGPATGLGLGWGQVGGGVWSKHGLLMNGVARLVTDLLEMLPFRNEVKDNKTAELVWRINCCLCAASVFGPGDGDMVHKLFANVLLHPDC